MEDATGETLAHVPFWYLRHGETDWNARGLSQGGTDIPLNPTGLAQARAAANRLRHRGIVTIVSSPLTRAQETAEIVAQVLDLPVRFDPDLKEVAFGVQEGQPLADWFPDWVAGNRLPEGAETFAGLRCRAIAAVNRCTAMTAPVLIVGHGAFFRALRSAMVLPELPRTPNAVPFWCEPHAKGESWDVVSSLQPAAA
ncbi:MAG: histidine phosphatase family protein [Acetobacteraceae bacterium]